MRSWKSGSSGRRKPYLPFDEGFRLLHYCETLPRFLLDYVKKRLTPYIKTDCWFEISTELVSITKAEEPRGSKPRERLKNCRWFKTKKEWKNGKKYKDNQTGVLELNRPKPFPFLPPYLARLQNQQIGKHSTALVEAVSGTMALWNVTVIHWKEVSSTLHPMKNLVKRCLAALQHHHLSEFSALHC